jgi:acyl-coenzyme A thioesterase PaaI-like protein
MDSMTPPDMDAIKPELGWSTITMPFSTRGGRSFVDGDPEGHRLRVKMFVRDEDHRMFTKVWWGPHAEGPPGHGHGGSMAAVLDHAMGIAAWVSGHAVVAASINIDFHASIPLGEIYMVETWVNRVEGKKVYTEGRIYLDEFEKPYSSGTGLFIIQPLKKFTSLVDSSRHLPENLEGLKDRLTGSKG